MNSSSKVQQLKGMFPDLDASTIQSVLQTKNDNLEQCIDALVAMTSTTLSTEETQRLRDEAFTTLVNKVMRMTSDSKASKLVGNHGMSIQTVSWEDCARSKGSCWGPCISDMTLMVKDHALPVIRYPNFEDLTWDVEMDKIPLVVGNELQDQQLYTVSLTEYLQHMKLYLSKPDSWTGSKTSLHAAERDSHVIVSAQACFLPVPQSGDATFNVSLYNYQSYSGDPAVLAIVATAQGTSAQVVENGSQKLYFNKHGEKASFIGQRLSDARKEKQQKGEEPAKNLDAPMSKEEQQQNVIIIIQVPLKQKGSNRRGLFMMPSVASASLQNFCMETACFAQEEKCDVEDGESGKRPTPQR
ncbi:CRIM domain-containing protein [Balamuthia mandrillaris]